MASFAILLMGLRSESRYCLVQYSG